MYPIINGFVQLPNNLEKNKSAVSLADAIAAVPNLSLTSMDPTGGARLAGLKHGIQEWVEVDAEVVGCCTTPGDESETLKDIPTSNSRVREDDPPPPGESRWTENDPEDDPEDDARD